MLEWISKHPVVTGVAVLGGLAYWQSVVQQRQKRMVSGLVTGGSHVPPTTRNPAPAAPNPFPSSASVLVQ